VRAWTYTVKLGRRTIGTYPDLIEAVAALRAARGADRHGGHVVCALAGGGA
jgi:hypothetical protein